MNQETYPIINGPHANHIIHRTQLVSNGTIQPLMNWEREVVEFHFYRLRPHPIYGMALFHEPMETAEKKLEGETD